MIKIKSLIVITIVFTLLSCSKEKDKDFNNLCPDFVIYYFSGSGWTGWQFKINILYPDTLTIYERQYIPNFDERSAKYLINKNEIDLLFQDLLVLKNIRLRDYYGFGPNKPTDLPTTFIKYRLCNCSDSAGLYSPDENEVPNELYTLMGRVMRIVINHDTIISKNNK